MLDISDQNIRIGDIVLVNDPSYGLQFGVVEDLDADPIRVIIKFKKGYETVFEITDSSTMVLVIDHRQIPKCIRERLIAISKYLVFRLGKFS